MDEFEIIRRFFTPEIVDDAVAIGVGDDGAVIRPASGRELVVVVDSLVEGVHYPPALDPEDVGYRAVAVNLSDIAAMGATPRWMTLALTLIDADPDWLAGFSAGLSTAAAEHGVALIGGDTTRGSQVVATVQLFGDVEPGGALTRSGAQPDHIVYVSGTVGDAAAGLQILERGGTDSAEAVELADRFRRPSARVLLGQALSGVASAAIDVSDGLYADLSRLLAASGVAADLDVARLPLSRSLLAEYSEREARSFALTGGDDYELVITAPADVDMESLAARCDTPVTAVGSVRSGAGLRCLEDGAEIDIAKIADTAGTGYVHFSGSADE